MRRSNGQVAMGLILLVLSIVMYLVYFLLFRENQNMVVFLLESAVFLPIQILFVTLIIDQLLSDREKKAILHKMNMVIGVFFSETGTQLLRSFCELDQGSEKLCRKLIVAKEWSDGDFKTVARLAREHEYRMVVGRESLESLRTFLMAKRPFLVGLLENPNLLEHDSFTELLWAVFHLAEELAYRSDVRHLPDSDIEHLAGDVKRVYSLLVVEWLAYMKHLKGNYPYLFSLALRTNPFDPQARVEVR